MPFVLQSGSFHSKVYSLFIGAIAAIDSVLTQKGKA
jgi:hypothetical protein